MQEGIHGEDGDKGREEGGGGPKEEKCEVSHDREEEDGSDDPSLDELLDVPALGDIVVLGLLLLCREGISGWFFYVAVGGTGGCEPLSERMILKSLESDDDAIEVSFGRSLAHEDLVESRLVLEVEESREEGEDDDRDNHRFLVFADDRPYLEEEEHDKSGKQTEE